MKILIVSYLETTAPGGISRAVKEIATELAKNGHGITILQPNPHDLPAEEQIGDVRLLRMGDSRDISYFGLHRSCASFLRSRPELKPDLVHVHGYHSLFSIQAIQIVRRLHPSVPIVFSPHMDIAHSTWAGRHMWPAYNALVGRRLGKWVEQVVCVSNFEAQMVAAAFRMSVSDIEIVPLGVSKLVPAPVTRPGGRLHILYAGHLITRKGVPFILAAYHELQARGRSDIALTIIGEGPEAHALREQAIALGVVEKIQWKPFLGTDELEAEIRACGLFVLLSHSEAFGIIIAEALALGTPVLVTQHTALEEFIHEPGCFTVRYPPRASEVADAIEAALQQPVTVGPFTQKIRLWSSVAEDFASLYSRLISARAKK